MQFKCTFHCSQPGAFHLVLFHILQPIRKLTLNKYSVVLHKKIASVTVYGPDYRSFLLSNVGVLFLETITFVLLLNDALHFKLCK